jgi:hypothetical protein
VRPVQPRQHPFDRGPARPRLLVAISAPWRCRFRPSPRVGVTGYAARPAYLAKASSAARFFRIPVALVTRLRIRTSDWRMRLRVSSADGYGSHGLAEFPTSVCFDAS